MTEISTETLHFEAWPCQQVQVEHGTIYIRHHGQGPLIMLLHGVPQHSLMFHTIAVDLVAAGFTVVVPDLPGMGQSLHTGKAKLTSKNASRGIHRVLQFLKVDKLSIFAYDKGCGPAVLLARDYPQLVENLIVSEYALPGFGHEIIQQPSSGNGLFNHWHLGLFTVPEAASFLIKGREERFLTWYFWHSSYRGLDAMKPEHFRRYVQEWQRPGGMEAGIEFLGGSVWEDLDEFRDVKIRCRMLAVGGEASMGRQVLHQL